MDRLNKMTLPCRRIVYVSTMLIEPGIVQPENTNIINPQPTVSERRGRFVVLLVKSGDFQLP